MKVLVGTKKKKKKSCFLKPFNLFSIRLKNIFIGKPSKFSENSEEKLSKNFPSQNRFRLTSISQSKNDVTTNQSQFSPRYSLSVWQRLLDREPSREWPDRGGLDDDGPEPEQFFAGFDTLRKSRSWVHRGRHNRLRWRHLMVVKFIAIIKPQLLSSSSHQQQQIDLRYTRGDFLFRKN